MNEEPEGRELASKCLLLAKKRFYFDVKQNSRGRFIKIAEVGISGKKSRIVFSIAMAIEFCELLLSFSNFDKSQQQNDNSPNQDDGLKSERVERGNRLYYFDLKENNNGRYLRCTQLSVQRGGPRTQITIPEPNILEFRSTLLELLNEFGQEDGQQTNLTDSNAGQQNSTANANNNARDSSKSQNNHSNNNTSQNGLLQLPESRVLNLEHKRYYFDIRQNRFGVYMKISEVKPTIRATVTIPEKSWTEFRDMFNECMEKMSELRAVGAS